MRVLSGFALGICFAVLLMAIGLSRPPPVAVTVNSVGPTREKLESLQELVIQRVEIADILTYTEGSLSAAWLVRGDGLISVSLHDAVIDRIHLETRTASIKLPPPKVLSARVDHERTMFWDHKEGILNRLSPWGASLPDVETKAMKAAQRLVQQAVDSPEHHRQARVLTTTLITNLYASLGWTVTIQWQDDSGDPPAATVLSP